MAHTKPPTFPVRYNRRTTMVPNSLLNGDNLPLLKKIRTSEMAPNVQGHNASLWKGMSKTVNQFYTEEMHEIEKVKKKQYATFTELARLHLERRQLRRTMIEWRREEARIQISMEKQEAKRRREREQLDQQIARATAEARPLPRKDSQIYLNRQKMANVKSKVNTGLRKNSQATKENDKSDEKIILENVTEEENTTEQNEPTNITADELQNLQNLYNKAVEDRKKGNEKPLTEPVEVEATAKVLVATRSKTKDAPIEPLVRTRTGSFIKDEQESSNKGDRETTSAIDSVTKANKTTIPAQTRVPPAASSNESLRSRQTEQRFTTIHEDDTPTPQQTPRPVRSTQLPPLPATPRPAADADILDVQNEGESSANPLVKSTKMTQADINRVKKKRMEEYQQKILNEPFTCYRRDADGILHSMGNEPPRFKTDEPSMRDQYERDKLMKLSRQNYVETMYKLRKHTATMVNEDIVNNAQLEIPSVDEGKKIDETFAEDSHTIGPAAWMRVFINDTLPEDVDPTSFEAMQNCRYLRNDDEEDLTIPTIRETPELKEEDKEIIRKNNKRERRISSWEI